MIQRKYYPWVWILIFHLIFMNTNFDIWCGLAAGYMWHYGLFNKCNIEMAKAKEWEKRFPFRVWAEKPYFIKVDLFRTHILIVTEKH